MLRTVYRESRCNPTARSRTADSGLLQVNDVNLGWLAARNVTVDDLYTVPGNLYAGLLLWRAYGWRPWRGGA
jgi:soluble lytic murein transglycosylase-like protein